MKLEEYKQEWIDYVLAHRHVGGVTPEGWESERGTIGA